MRSKVTAHWSWTPDLIPNKLASALVYARRVLIEISSRHYPQSIAMTVLTVENIQEFEEKVNSQPLVIVDFFASWCSPCHAVGNLLLQQSNRLPHVLFVRMNLDENEQVAKDMTITALPTFFFYHNGTKVDEMMGNDLRTLRSKIVNHAQLELPQAPPVVAADPNLLKLDHAIQDHPSDDEKTRATVRAADQRRDSPRGTQ